jgi:flavoprotein
MARAVYPAAATHSTVSAILLPVRDEVVLNDVRQAGNSRGPLLGFPAPQDRG